MTKRLRLHRVSKLKISSAHMIAFMLAASCSIYSETLYAARLTVEETASLVVSEYNKKYTGVIDDFTVASSASSDGKNVIFTNVWAIRKGATADEIEKFVIEWKSEMIPQVCRVNKSDYAFNNGLYYTFVFKNRQGAIITEYSVDKAWCKKIMK